MLNLIRADIYRIARGKALYITLAALLAVSILNIVGWQSGELGAFVILDEHGNEIRQAVILDAYDVEIRSIEVSGVAIPLALAQSMETFAFFILPVIVVVAGTIFSHGTVKNDIAFGISRTKLYFSKLLLSADVCILMLLFYIGVSMIIATIIGGFGGPAPAGHWVELIQIFSAQLLLLLALTSIGVFLAFVTKWTSIVIAAYLAFLLVPPLVISSLSFANESLARLFEFDMLSNIMMLGNLPNMDTSDILRALGLGVFYLLASTIAGVAIFRRVEIK